MPTTPTPAVVPILVYEDIEAAHDFLVGTFGLASGGLHRLDDGTVVHGEVRNGGAPIWLHQVAADAGMASPHQASMSHGGLSVRIPEVDAHYDRVKAAGPRLIFYDLQPGEEITVCLALPVAEPPGDLPEPARYRVLPEIEAATTVRSGPAVSIFPVVYHDLIRWIGERGYHAVAGPGREVWVNEIEDIADVAQQVFEIQLPFTRAADE